MIFLYNYSFIFRYAIKLRFVREYINKTLHKMLNEAVKYGPEKHKEFQKRSQQVLNEGR